MRQHVVLAALGAVGLAVAACSPPSPLPRPGSPEALAAYLQAVVGADAATRQGEAGGWLLGPALWDATIVPVYRPLYAEYRRAFAAWRAPGRSPPAATSPATLAEARDRWALPPLFPSLVAEASPHHSPRRLGRSTPARCARGGKRREADRGARPEAQRGSYWTYWTSENRPYATRCPRRDGRSRRRGE